MYCKRKLERQKTESQEDRGRKTERKEQKKLETEVPRKIQTKRKNEKR